ncbi:sensor histidine kinase [Taibaiella koreensis]|uniref:sensor histidine kinase n=1 Tax=Taibaiella koreensis TaxID=1268548 RepID=UPI000E59F07E|nr:two-component regulator propeller domain-containing protein [Taibaiella koreensis]
MPDTISRLLLLTCLTLLLLSRTVAAQEMSFVNVTGKLGLPATECYNVFQDSKGYIWISTEAGLCRYNGSNLQVFDKRNGLPERGVYAYMEDKLGQLWLATRRNRILIYKNGKLTEAPFSKQYQHLHDKFLTYGIREYGENKLVLQNYYLTYTVDLVTQSMEKTQKAGTAYQVHFERAGDQLIPLNFICASPSVTKSGALQLIFRKGGRADTLNTNLDPGDRSARLLSCKAGDYFFCSLKDKLIRLSPAWDIDILPQKNAIVSLYADKSDGIWVGMKDNGVNYYPSGKEPGKHIALMKGLSVTGICEDREGNVWLTTLEKGLLVCKNKRVVSFAGMQGLNKPASMLRTVNGSVLVSTDPYTIMALSGNTPQSFSVRFNPSHIVADVIPAGRNKMLVLKGMPVFTDSRFKELYRPKTDEAFYGSEGRLTQTKASGSFLSGLFIMCLISGSDIVMGFRLPDKSIDMCPASGDSLLLGCRNGLYILLQNDTVLHKVPGIDKAVTRIFKAADETIWITTKEEGLYQFVHNRLRPAGRELELKTDIFFDITEDRYRNIWLGSNAGLIRLASPVSKHSVKYFNTTNSLPANEVFKLAADSQYIYISTVEGISRIPLSDTGNNCPPPVYLSAFKVNGANLGNDTSPRTFAYNKNNIELDFDVLSFDLEDRSGLWYRINNGAFVSQKGNILKLDNLAHGDYRLEVYGLTADGTKSTRPVILSFAIALPFWKTWWFVLMTVLLLAALVYIWLERRIAKVKRTAGEKNRLGKLISSYKLLALQAQMNPHFIFNSINCIQYFILEQKEQEAYQYLSKFSRLLRDVLHHSDKLSIRLDQEIDTLSTYIALEQYRFENKFVYELHIGAGININEVTLPPMLVQPYVENAIWHGLLSLPRGSKGKLWLGFLREGPLLKIVIRDNGVGRESAARKKRHMYPPVAMDLTAKRLGIVHQIWGDATIKVNITDLYDESQMPAGTLVELFLPVNMPSPEGL